MTQHTVNTPYMVGPVHFYTFETNHGIIMFDTGPNTLEAISYLNKHIDLKKLSYLFITHCHIDHYGLTYHIKQNSDARIFLSRYDYLKFKHYQTRFEKVTYMLEEEGFPKHILNEINYYLEGMKRLAPFPEGEIIEENRDLLNQLNLDFLRCPGHSQSDIVYLFQNYAITGDVILRDVFQTPLLDLNLDDMKTRYNNYLAYIETIDKLISLNGYTILPGHREYIDDIKQKISIYLNKMLTRGVKIGKSLVEDSIYDIIVKINNRKQLDSFTQYLKASEIFFIRDIFKDPKPLQKTINRHSLDIDLNKYIEEIYG
ncbi:MBL fold metallo-hydrolase [Calditerrivibrio nitroreducens]|uniref:Beta-lactamase domain-containing protein n=1 Tax=Calditerrivibrio nitroreducens (strain DSM 19672 / NBRC 101217 / Yu37-1) TaxID=768670 RepID=E4TK01_CALNY|nr:MBL fold metallo-hydrolase [Calditerrivibrio nitroreducens]ADR18252.1 beta-lactamase domain-containing protein [Calditerrivibrio nitroreducens DSM 19672]